MKKARKVRTAGRSAPSKPRISHRKASKPKRPARDEKPSKAEAKAEAKAEPKGKPALNARLAAMMAASAEMEEVPEPTKTKAPPAGGVAWKDLEEEDEEPGKPSAPVPAANGGQPRKGTVIEVDDEATMAPTKAKTAAVEDGVEVVAKGPSKFSLADLEVLKAAIKVKGAGVVVEGINLDELKYDAEGLVPIVAQDRRTGAVLQLGWGNKETVESSLRTKQMTYWSREHGKAIGKGEGSGHPQRLVQMRVDCDKDSLLALVDQDGPACHLDKGTCWTDGRTPPVATFLGELDRQVQAEAKAPKPGSDVAKLLAEPLGALKAFVEDANTVTRSLQGKQGAKAVEQGAADALYHLIVAMRAKGVGFDKVVTELFARQLAEEMNRK